MDRTMEDFFLNLKPVEIMIRLKDPGVDNYASELSTRVDSTYSHTVRTLQSLEEFGLVTSEKEGRKKVIRLTEKGERVAEKLNRVMREFHEV